jgi:hypothetical protein
VLGNLKEGAPPEEFAVKGEMSQIGDSGKMQSFGWWVGFSVLVS